MKLAPGLVIAQKYKLDRVLATGGMGSVWIAQNTHLKIPVAIKFMAPATVGSPELVARFEQEATAAARVRGPHVVQIFEHGVDRGTPYIAMELLEGESLAERLRHAERLTIDETARVVSAVCKALRRAHEQGVIHRDLKPANIFLARHDDEEIVKVLDFGVAKCVAEAGGCITKTGQLVGTAHYMSPEQVQCKKELDHRSDLWSLGIIAFRALTGRMPFPSATIVDAMLRIFTEPAPPPSAIVPELGPQVDRFFARALAISPDARFQSAREMSDAMNALAGRASLADTSAPESPRPGADLQEPQPTRESPAAADILYTNPAGPTPAKLPALPAAPAPTEPPPPAPLPPPAAPASPAAAVPATQQAMPPSPPAPAPSVVIPPAQLAPPAPQAIPPAVADLRLDLSWVSWLAVGAGLLVVAVVTIALLASG